MSISKESYKEVFLKLKQQSKRVLIRMLIHSMMQCTEELMISKLLSKRLEHTLNTKDSLIKAVEGDKEFNNKKESKWLGQGDKI